MKRCPQCREANPDSGKHCTRCGARLPLTEATPAGGRAWLDPEAALRACLASLPVLFLYGLMFPWTFGALPVSDSRLLANHLCLGLGLSFGVAAVRRAGNREYPVWLIRGILAGTGSFLVDFLYNYQHLIYRLVFFAADQVAPQSSVIFPFRLLQALRFAAAGFVLALALYKKEGNWRAWLWYLVCVATGSSLRAWVRGRPADFGWAKAGLSGNGAWAWFPAWNAPDWARLGHLALYFLSLWAVLYGLGRRAPGKLGRFSP